MSIIEREIHVYKTAAYRVIYNTMSSYLEEVLASESTLERLMEYLKANKILNKELMSIDSQLQYLLLEEDFALFYRQLEVEGLVVNLRGEILFIIAKTSRAS